MQCTWTLVPTRLVSAPDPTDAAADGLHHRYASVGSGAISWPENATIIKFIALLSRAYRYEYTSDK